MELREYQQEAKDAVYKYFKENTNKNPCVVLPTGAGKTPLLASICTDVVTKRHGRVLVVAHVKELLEQAYNTLTKMCPEIHIGLYSAGLNAKETAGDVIIAGVQSVYKNAFGLGKFDLVIVDEAHLIPPNGDGMYQQLLKDLKLANPKIKLVGLTATPYRLRTGHLCNEDSFLNDICYEANVKDLIEQGYLSKLQTRAVHNGVDVSNLHIVRGEYASNEVDALVNNNDVVSRACFEIVEKKKFYERKKALIFASNVSHAKNIKKAIEELSKKECGIVLGDTVSKERAETLSKFKNNEIEYLVNVGVLTTGFDDPSVDLVALIRPTASPGLYYQMVGRGLRLAEGKEYCLILDFGQNIDRHGPIDEINIKKRGSKKDAKAPVKTCPKCELIVHAATRTCPDCGFVFELDETESKIQARSSNSSVISEETIELEYDIDSVEYSNHVSKKGINTLKVTYRTADDIKCYEWINLEHEGYPRFAARKWWIRRCKYPLPYTVRDAIKIIKSGSFATTKKIVVKKTKGEKYDKIIKHELSEVPDKKPNSEIEKIDVVNETCGTCVLRWPTTNMCIRCVKLYMDFSEKEDNHPCCCEYTSKQREQLIGISGVKL